MYECFRATPWSCDGLAGHDDRGQQRLRQCFVSSRGLSALDQVMTFCDLALARAKLLQDLSVAFESQLAPRLTPINFSEQRNMGQPKGTSEATRGESKHRRATNLKDMFCQPLSSNRTKNGTERMTRSDSNSDREARLRLWLAGCLAVWLWP